MFRIFEKFRQRILDLPTFRNRADSTEADQQDFEQGLLSDVLDQWPLDEPFRVEAVLERYPELRNSEHALIDLALEEFHRRRLNGEEITEVRFADQFPGFRTALLDSLLFENVLECNSWFEQALMPQVQNRDVKWPIVGETIADFRLIEPLGSGGFSRVFVAEDLKFNNRRVALKICRSDTHEANTLAELQHTAIGTVHYVRDVPERGLTAICMPFCSRTTLYDVIRRSWRGGTAPRTAHHAWNLVRDGIRLDRLDVPWANSAFGDWVLDLTIMLARALAASHEKDIVHCDLKPSNILISAEGLPILVDFNVAFRRSASASPGNVGGTMPYMAPEQIRAFAGDGFSDISGQTDIYGLGATIYELLTGKMPFGEITSADDGVRPLLQLRRDGAVPIRKLNRDVDPEFAALLDTCLSYDISARPATAELLADKLEKIRDRRRTRRPVTATAIRTALATAAAAIVASAAFFSMESSEAANTGQRQLAATVRASGIKHVAPRRQEDIVAELVDTAYDAFDSDDFEVAYERFKKAAALDVEHEGAILGQIRCCIRLGKSAVAARLVQNWTSARTMESMALRAYFSGLDGSWEVAADAFSKARAAGIDTPAVRTNLAYALLKLRRFDDAQKIAEELLRDFGNDTGATLTQAQIYLMQQQDHENSARKALLVQRKRPVTDPLEFYDSSHVEFLIESAPEGPARAFVAGMVYPMLSMKLKSVAPEESRRLLDLAVNEFDKGVQLGYDQAHWNSMKLVLDGCLPGYIADSALAQKYANVPANSVAPLVTPLFLIDPISESRLDRWTGRHLNDFIEAADSALVATK